MEDKYFIPYINLIVRRFAERFRLTVQEAFRYLYNFKGIHFLNEFYDVEHTVSVDDAIVDLITVCKKNGGQLG